MDYDKLIERLKCPHLHRCPMYDEYPSCKACQKSIQQEAALAIETLRADLTRVTAERDAAVADIAAILAEVEEIRRGYGVDNADADNAFADLCGNYCAKCGNNCYGEAEDYRCKNFEWCGIKED